MAFIPQHLIVEKVPQNTIALLQTNRRFIESYMVGCNHEFAGELLWRKYPTDQRGIYFRQFWDVSEFVTVLAQFNFRTMSLEITIDECLKDINPLRNWKDNSLGENAPCPVNGDNVVLLIRGDLLKRYPNTVIYAVNVVITIKKDENTVQILKKKEKLEKLKKRLEREKEGLSDVSDEDRMKEWKKKWKACLKSLEEWNKKWIVLRPELEEFLLDYRPIEENEQETFTLNDPMFPIFKGTLAPDLTFLGFPFDEDKVRGNDGDYGVYFIFEERVGETRFGLDFPNENTFKSWDDLSWTNVELGTDDDIDKYIDGGLEIDEPENNNGKEWNENTSSATRAWITM